MNAPVPRQIQQQIDAAAKLQADMDAAAAQPAPGPALTPITEAAEVKSEPAQAPQPAPAAQAPAPQPAPAPAPAHEVNQITKLTNDFRAMMGRLHQQEQRSQQTIAQLTEQLAIAVNALKEKPAQQASSEGKPAWSAEDIDKFGADMLEMVSRYAENALRNMQSQLLAPVESLKARIEALEGNVQGVAKTATQSREDQYYAVLETLVPDYQAINARQDWLAWLDEKDPVYGVPRQAALDQAFAALDARQTANIFKAFLASRPAAPAAPVDTLASQVTPSAVANAGATVHSPQAEPVYSEKSITDFYNDVARGKYRGREAEQQRIEQAINRALTEGRVRR